MVLSRCSCSYLHLSVHSSKEFATRKHLPVFCNGVAKIQTTVVNAPISVEVVGGASHDQTQQLSTGVLQTKPNKDDYISRLQA